MIDLLVAGGGPAGLASALNARRCGLDVVVAEPRGAPADKACGEGVMPAGVRALAELGVEVPGFPIAGVAYLDGRHRAHADFRHGCGRGIRRVVLSAALRAAAQDAGVAFVDSHIGSLEQQRDCVRAGGLIARYLIGADGLHSTVRRAVERAARPPRQRRRWGVRAHFGIPPWSDRVEVYWSRDGEAYVTPVGDDLVGVALLGEHRAGFAGRLAAFPELARRLPHAAATEPLGAGPLRQRVRRHVSGRVLLVGDAAGYVDALTGEGLSLAFAEAARAVRAVADDEPQRYESECRRITRTYRWLTGALVAATRYEPTRRCIVPLAEMAPAAFRAGVQMIGG